MTDDHVDTQNDEPDDATEARVTEALRVSAPMPDDVWARLERALHAEASSAVPAQAPLATVTPLRRRTPLLAGLAAAAAVVVAMAVVVPNLMQSSTDSAVVASEPLPGVESVAAAAPMAKAAAPLTTQAEAAAQAPADQASTPLAARQVMMSGTDYTPETMDEAVATLVDSVDVNHARLLSSVSQEPDPTAGSDGFTATTEGLAGCLQALTASTAERALVVDRATFNGADVGIVVVPSGAGASDPSMPFDSIEIWVVRPDCSSVKASIVWHDTMPVSAP